MRFPIHSLASLACFTLAGCVYNLDVEGKRCNEEHPCPPGYSCVYEGDDGGAIFVCKKGPGDGGADGADQGPCTEGERACKEGDPGILLECNAEGTWDEIACGEGTYCFFTGTDDELDCVPDCEGTVDCGREDYYCNSATHHCEEKGDCSPVGGKRCLYGGGQDSVEECMEESGLWEETPCAAGQYCHDVYITCLDECTSDADCADLPSAESPEPNSCNLANNKCRRLDLCPEYNTCDGTENCEQGACVLKPETDADGTGGTPDLQCVKDGAPEDTGTATECLLEGNVIEMIRAGDPTTDETVGLTVEVFAASDILDGNDDPLSALGSTVTTTDGQNKGFYHFQDPVPTGQELVLVVRAGTVGDPAVEFVSSYHFGVYLRADECEAQSGTLTVNAPALKKDLYHAYTAAGILLGVDTSKGLLVARLLDCTDVDRLIHGTVGTSLPFEEDFYVVIDIAWVPASESTETTATGFYGAANVTAIRGLVSALAKESSGLVSLGTKDVRIFPYSVSEVIFKEPKEPL